METIFVVLGALLLPGSGVTRAIEAIRRHSRTEPDPLKRAVRAGALCMVVRHESSSKTLVQQRLEEVGRVQVVQTKGGEHNQGVEEEQEE